MKRKALLKSALAWILALSMAIPNTALTAYAAETGMETYAEQNAQEQEKEEQAEEPASEENGEEPELEETGDGQESPEEDSEKSEGQESLEENAEESDGEGDSEEEVSEEESDEEESGEENADKEELTADDAGTIDGAEYISDIKAEWSAYRLNNLDVLYTRPDGATGTYGAILIELDADGSILATHSEVMTAFATEDLNIIRFRSSYKIVLKKATKNVRLEVKESQVGDETSVTFQSALIPRTEVTCNPVFSLEQEGQPGMSKASFRWSVTGYECPEGQSDDFGMTIYYQPEGGTKIGRTFSINVSPDKTTDLVEFNYLSANTQYSVYAEFFIQDGNDKVFTQTTAPITIRTEEDTEYTFKEIIPDEALRAVVAKRIGSGMTKDTEKIMKSQLEQVTYLTNNRSSCTDAAVQSLQGLEYFTNLGRLTLTCHELTDISNVDWSKLGKLSYLWLTGNNIDKPVDLSGAAKLGTVGLNENKLTQEVIEQIREKLPAGAEATFENQRVNGVYLLTEPVYYPVETDEGRKTPLFVRIKGLPSSLSDYPLSFAVDGTSVEAVKMESNLYRIDSELEPKEEPYTLTVMVDGEALEAAFRVEEDRPAAKGAYLGQEWSNASFEVQISGSGKSVSKAEMVDKKGICYGVSDYCSGYSTSSDNRYTTVGEGYGIYLNGAYKIYRYSGSLEPYKNSTPAGSYDLKFTYEDDTTQTFANVFQVMADGKAYVNRIYDNGGCDSSKDQLYFMVEGGNVDFSRLDYHVTYGGEERTVSYVSAKRNGNRYTVRLKKEGWTVESHSNVTLEITAKDGYDVEILTGKTTVYIQSGVYYVEWNQTSYALEVAVTQDTQVSSMRVELKNNLSEDDWGDEGQEFLTGETDQVQQGFASVPMRDAEGKTVFVPYQYYRVKIYVNGNTVPIYNEREYLGSYSSSSNNDVSASWSAYSYLIQGTDNIEYAYSSVLDYQEHKNDTFQMKLENSAGTEIKTLNSKLYSWKSGGSEYVRVTVSSADFCDQEPGKYTLRLYQNENKLANYQVTILPKERFYMGSQYASWDGDDTIQISVRCANVKKGDKLNVELYDPYGTKVEGLTTKVSSIYSSGNVYLSVTGLRRQESYRKYWIKVTHADYGAPYKLTNNNERFYSDEKGAQQIIWGSSLGYYTKDNRVVGVYCTGWKFPITIEAYLPYDTEVKSSFTAQKASNGSYGIYFTKAFIDNLEDKDRLYDVVVTDSTGRSAMSSKHVLGYMGTTSKLTGLTLSPATMKLAAGETGKLVLGTKPADAPMPASVNWKSSDEKIAKVDAQGVVTGVAFGTAKITVTGGGFTASCTVTVTESVKAPTVDMAEGEVEKNTVVHLSSETDKATIYYTVDGSDPTAKSLKYNVNTGITIRRETTIRAIAVRSGYADSEIASFHYTVPAVTVTFDTDGGTPETAPQTVDKGDYLDPVKINEPEKEGYRFLGWYLEEKELDVNAPVTESVTYTARWEEGIELNAPEANYLDGKELADGAKITLTVYREYEAVKDAEIYYTLDGSTPTKDSSRYEGAIILHKESAEDEPVTVKAFAAGKGYKQSGVSTYTYTLLKDAEGTFGEIEAEDIPEVPVPNGIWIAGLEDTYTYTGSAIKPQIRVYHGTKKLTEKKDYTISYSNNINVPDEQTTKKPMVTIKGKGNYKDSLTVYFQILPKDISDSDVTAEDLYVVAGNKEQKKVPVLKWGKKTLSAKKEKDYSVSYGSGDFKTPGRYTIELTGKGNYTGERRVTETILEKNTEYLMSKVTVTVKDKKVSYTGSPLTPDIVVKNGRNEVSASDYEVTYLNNVEVGKATIRVRGLHDYKGVKEVTFQITGIPMSKVRAEGITNAVYQAGTQEYTQSGYKLSYSYKDAQKKNQTKVLTEGADYTVSYRNNTKAGKAEIWFTGKGAYTGVLKKSYQISPCAEFNPEVIYPEEVSYCKGGARPEVTVKMGEVTLTGGTDYKVKYESNTKVYDASKQNSKKAQIVITGTGNYKGTVRKEFVITRKDISALNMSAQDLVYKNSKGNYKTKIVITDTDGKALKAGTDYRNPVYYLGDEKVEDKANLPAGTEVTVKAEGKGAYTGTIQTTFRIAAKSFGGVTGKIEEQTYTGEEVTLTKDKITLTIGKGKNQVTLTEDDFEIVGYKNNIKKGTATVILKGKGSYAGTKNVTFKIGAKEFPRLIVR